MNKFTLGTLILTSTFSASAFSASATFYEIQSSNIIGPSAVSNLGDVALGGAVWNPVTGGQTFGYLYSAIDISSDGKRVLSNLDGYYIDGNFVEFDWPENDLTPQAMSNDASVVVGVVSHHRGYQQGDTAVWTASQGFLDVGINKIFDVSPNGQFAVGKRDDNLAVLVSVNSGETQQFDTKTTCWTGCGRLGFRAVSDNGVPVGYYTFDNYTYEAAYWNGLTPIRVGGISATNKWSVFNDTSADGKVMVGSSYSNDEDVSARGDTKEAIIWDAQGGVRSLEELLEQHYNLDLAGWKLTEATAISNDGFTVTGTGINPQGAKGHWMITITAECTASAW